MKAAGMKILLQTLQSVGNEREEDDSRRYNSNKNYVKFALFADLLYIIGTNWGMHLRMYT